MVGQREGVCSVGWDLKIGNGGMVMAGLVACGGAVAERG
jgi:hypothetical protein